jgi:luciferase family oxidoreductase group 1
MRLSIVDLGTVAPESTEVDALVDSLAVARYADSLGYHRIWFAEHHANAMGASHHPEVLIAAAGAQTTGIRVGSGAVLMNHYSPFKVAEMFAQLEAMFPGRVDLGMGRATGGPVVDIALQRDRERLMNADHSRQVLETLAWLYDDFPRDHPFGQVQILRSVSRRPQSWLLGSSPGSSNLAAALGIGYTFAAFINPAAAATALINYRRNFTSGRFTLDQPRTIIAVNVTVGETEEHARHLVGSPKCYYSRLGRGDVNTMVPTADEAAKELSTTEKDEPTAVVAGRWPRFVAGDPEQVRATVEQMVAESQADEVMVQNLISDPRDRHRSHQLLAEVFDLPKRG